MYNLDLDYCDFLCETFDSDLSKNETLVNNFCSDILDDRYWFIIMEEIDSSAIVQKLTIEPDTLRLQVPFAMSLSGPSQSIQYN